MRTFTILLTVIAAMLCGCTEVSSVRPVGTEVLKVTTEEADGTWLTNGGSVLVNVIDGEAGHVRIHWLEGGNSNEASGTTLESADVFLRRHGEHTFANVLIKDEESATPPNEGEEPAAAKPAERYVLALMKRDDNQVLLWIPDFDVFRKLAEENTWPVHHQSSNTLVLGILTAEQLDLLAREIDANRGFHWRDPLVLLRVR